MIDYYWLGLRRSVFSTLSSTGLNPQITHLWTMVPRLTFANYSLWLCVPVIILHPNEFMHCDEIREIRDGLITNVSDHPSLIIGDVTVLNLTVADPGFRRWNYGLDTVLSRSKFSFISIKLLGNPGSAIVPVTFLEESQFVTHLSRKLYLFTVKKYEDKHYTKRFTTSVKNVCVEA